MAPTTIAIRSDIDPISPLPVRVNDFPESKIPSPTTKSRPGRYLSGKPTSQKGKKEPDSFDNVQRKIEAIMYEMDQAKKRYDELKNEKFFQNDTIQAQELQIKQMEEQIALLNERLKKEEIRQKEEHVEKQMEKTEELEQQAMLQEMEIMNLTAELEQKKAVDSIDDKIKQQEASNAAKYAEIQRMEEKLKNMQKEQEGFKRAQAEIVRKNTEDQADFVAKPTSETYAEINKLQDEITLIRAQQEKMNKLAILPPAQKPSAISSRTSSSKSQPWNQDLQWKEGVVDKKTELEVLANAENPAESVSESEDLSLPSLVDKKNDLKPVGKMKISSDRSVSSQKSSSLESIAEENENQPEEPKEIKRTESNSDTSATGESSSSSFSAPQISSQMSMSDSDDASTNNSSSVEDGSVISVKQENGNQVVEIMPRDDGSIEAVGYTRLISKEKEAMSASFSSKSNDSSKTGSFDSAESGESSSRDSSGESSSGVYSSESSAQSSSRSILEQIPEEEDDSDGDSEDSESVDVETKELKAGSLILRKQLKESESKYDMLMEDYKKLVTNSQVRMDKLEEDNQKLRMKQGAAMKSTANESEEEKKQRWLKQENKMLLKSMEKQNDVLDTANKNYQKLQNEHTLTLAQLETQKKRYDKLILDFSNLAGTGKNSEDYNRLKALHQTVVMKVADLAEDNDRLERERDAAIDQLESKDIKIRAYDEAIAVLNKTEYDLKQLEDVHAETIDELQQLTEKNKELQEMYEKEVTDRKYSDNVEENFVKAKTEMAMLKVSNKQYAGIEERLNASEVKVAMLEEESDKMKQKLHATKKKSKTRADQLKDVISQYKALETQYSEKCAELERVELAASGLDSENGIKEMKMMTESLLKMKKQADEAKAGKRAREKDMRIVLEHYEKLQRKYEKLKYPDRKPDPKPFDQPFDEAPAMEEEKKDEETESQADSHASSAFERVEILEKMLKESKESINWKDDKIALSLSELKAAKKEIATLEKEKEELEAELSDVKAKLLLAKKEAENAEEKQDNGMDKLRDAIAKHHQLQQVYDSLLKKFGDARGDLEKAKKEIKVKEQEEKTARKRSSDIHAQYKKLQEDHDVVVKELENIKKVISSNTEAVVKEEEAVDNNLGTAEC